MKIDINQDEAEVLLYALEHWISYNEYTLSKSEMGILKEFSELFNKVSRGEEE